MSTAINIYEKNRLYSTIRLHLSMRISKIIYILQLFFFSAAYGLRDGGKEIRLLGRERDAVSQGAAFKSSAAAGERIDAAVSKGALLTGTESDAGS